MSARLQDLQASFGRHLRAEGRSPRTVVLYGQSIRFFCEWLEAQGRPATLDELNRASIRAWLAGLADRQAPGTVATRYRGMRRFCGWLVDEDELDEHPMAKLKPPELKAKPVPVLSDDELKALVKATQGKTFNHRRDEVVLRLLLDCGLRVSELCGLDVEDVDLDLEVAMVTGKGNKSRPIYLSPRTIRAVDRYLRLRAAHRWAGLPSLLLTQRGAMTPDGVRERMKVLGKAAGIEGLHPHRFRHTFAHDYLMSGGQERDLKRLAGWSSDTMLERYGASAADARAKAAVQRMRRGDRV